MSRLKRRRSRVENMKIALAREAAQESRERARPMSALFTFILILSP